MDDSGTPAGWYPDPYGSGALRYWDGATWTAHVQAAQQGVILPSAVPAGPGWRHSRHAKVVAACVAAVLLVVALQLAGVYPGLSLHVSAFAGRDRPEVPTGQAAPTAHLTVTPPLTQQQTAALHLGQPAGELVVTPAEAERVFATLWTLREQAVTGEDIPRLHSLEAGSAAFGDVARIRCGCPMRTSPGGYDEHGLYVPRQVRYPARFAVEVATTQSTGSHWAEIMVFERASYATAWKLALDTGYTPPGGRPPALSQPSTDARGYLLPMDPRESAFARTLPGRLADYWQRAKNGERPDPGVFSPGTWTTREAAKLAEHPQGSVFANGLVGHSSFAASGRLFEFYAGAFGELACGVVWNTVVFTPRGRYYPQQGPDRNQWGPELAPGLYASVTDRDQNQTCFSISGADAPVAVVGGDGLHEVTSSGVRLRP